MLIKDVCRRDVVFAPCHATVRAAARLMRERHVGDVVVVDRADPERMPMGIVTDRDVTVEVVACGRDADALTLGELVQWGELVCVQETATYDDTLRLMHAHGIRRVPVINAAGVLVGVVSIDDVLPRLSRELHDIAELAQRGRQREMATRT